MTELRSSSVEPASTAPAAELASAQGSVSAALVSASIGCLILGLTDVLADASPALNKLFSVYNPSGALSGETTLAVLLWLVTWFLLGRRWARRPPGLSAALGTALTVLLVGLALTYPPVVHLLSGH